MQNSLDISQGLPCVSIFLPFFGFCCVCVCVGGGGGGDSRVSEVVGND